MIKVKFLIREKTISDKEVKLDEREKVQEEALVIIVASVVLSAVVFAIDTVSWQIFHTFL